MIRIFLTILFVFGCEPDEKRVVEYVPVFSPPEVDPPPLPPPSRDFLGFDWFESYIINDLSNLSSVDQQNAFYMAGCDAFNQKQEQVRLKKGIDKGINSLSTERFLTKSVQIGDCLYRIDQTDYGLTNAELELVTDRALFSVVSDTVRGQTIRFLTQKNVPWSFSGDFFNTALEGDFLTDFNGDTYRTLVGQAADDVTFFADEGLDLFEEFENEDALAGGTNDSPIAFQGRLFWIAESNNGFMHQAHDVSLGNAASINEFPFFLEAAVAPGVQVTDAIFPFVAKETLYPLLNGMMAVRLSDNLGNGIGFAPGDVVRDARQSVAANGLEPVIRPAACFDCHAKWTIGYVDEISDHVLGTNFDENEKLLALIFYNDAKNQDAFRITDQAYAVALQQLDIDPTEPDPLNDRQVIPLRSEYDADKAAAKFFLTTRDYLDCLRGADVSRANLGAHLTGGKVALQVMADNFNNVIVECNLFRDIEL